MAVEEYSFTNSRMDYYRLDTDDITEEEPAGDSNTDSAGETHTQEMESKKKFIVKTVEDIKTEKAINMIYAFVRKLAVEE